MTDSSADERFTRARSRNEDCTSRLRAGSCIIDAFRNWRSSRTDTEDEEGETGEEI